MCEILGFARLEDCISLDCTPYDGEFAGANRLRIHDASGAALVVDDFVVEKQRNCFGECPPTPWIVLKSSIPENFLREGNRLELFRETATV